MNYNNRKFKAIGNSKNGETTAETIFEYKQERDILTAQYKGGEIVKGHLIGRVDAQGYIDMRYHQVNRKGELRTGKCQSRPEILANGKIRLHEIWERTSGDLTKGSSILEEF